MKNILRVVFLILIVGLLAPLFVQAQGLVPSGCQTGCPCTLCDFYELAQNVIQFLLFALAIPIGALMFLYGGITLLTSQGNPNKLTAGRTIITNAVIGLAIAFFAFVIINALLQTLVFGISFGAGASPQNWFNPPSCELGTGGDCTTAFPPPPTPSGPSPSGPPPPTPAPAGTLTQAEAEALLDPRVTVVSTGSCNTQTDPTCTSFEGIPRRAIEAVNDIVNNCNCEVEITGGTEVGHETHGPGAGMLDLDAQKLDESPNTELRNYLTLNGISFIDEGDHFHVPF